MHDSSKNKAQLYLEDADGVPVAGHIAEEARQLVYSLLWSLMWSGQYASRSTALTYEARVYMHVVLAQNFPMLLYCTGGRWKTDLLISQQYSGFNSRHGGGHRDDNIKDEHDTTAEGRLTDV